MKTHKLRPLLRLLLPFLLAAIAPFTALAQETPAGETSPQSGAPPAVEKSLLDLFNAGGALMWPILLCSVGTIAVGVYCFLQINQKK